MESKSEEKVDGNEKSEKKKKKKTLLWLFKVERKFNSIDWNHWSEVLDLEKNIESQVLAFVTFSKWQKTKSLLNIIKSWTLKGKT